MDFFGLSRQDLATAVDGRKSLLKAVTLVGLRNQTCFAHGFDLALVRKIVFGPKSLDFDSATILEAVGGEDESCSDGDDRSDGYDFEVEGTDSKIECEDKRRRTACIGVSPGAGFDRVRGVARKPKNSWMNGGRLLQRKV